MDIEQASNQWHTVEEASKHGQESTASQDLLESFWSHFTGSSREMAQVRRDSSYPTENTRQQKIAKKKKSNWKSWLVTSSTGRLKAQSTPQLSGLTSNGKMWSTITYTKEDMHNTSQKYTDKNYHKIRTKTMAVFDVISFYSSNSHYIN